MRSGSKDACVELRERGEIETIVTRMLAESKDVAGYVVRDQSQYCGLIRAPIRSVIRNALRLVEYDGEDCIAFDANLSTGILLEWLADYVEVKPAGVYRITAWW